MTDACFAPVLTMAEAAEHPHMKARNTIVEDNGLPQPAPAPRFSRTPGRDLAAAGVARPAHRRGARRLGLRRRPHRQAPARPAPSSNRAVRSRHAQAAQGRLQRAENRSWSRGARRGGRRGVGVVGAVTVTWPTLRPGRGVLAVAVEVRARRPRAPRRGRGASPIAVDHRARRRRASVEPSGQPRIARRWFSNWLVTAPSIVQCPELWTRGAISFASERAADLEQLDREHADVVEVLEQRSWRSRRR